MYSITLADVALVSIVTDIRQLVIVNASLNRELNRSKGRHPIKQAMIKTEIKILLTRLREDRSIKGLENHAAVPHPSFSQ